MLDLGLRGEGRVRLVRQTEMAECGLASVTMVANSHGFDVDLATMRRRFSLSMRGVGLRSLIDIADQIGLRSRAVRAPLDGLAKLQLPAILHWNMNHFVVLERVKGEKALIHDPAGGTRWLPLSEVSNHFTGVALELTVGNGFEPRVERQRLRITDLWERAIGIKRALAQTLVLSAILQLFILAAPYYMQIAIDSALPALDTNLLAVLAMGFALLTVINAGAALLRGLVLLNAGTSLGFGLAVNIVRRLFRLPIAWFERRDTGDILSRFQSIAPIQQMLTEGAVAAVIDGCLAIFTLALMFLYSPLLAVIALTAFLLYAAVRLLTFSLQRSAQEARIIASGREQTTLIESLRGIATLRLFGQEALRHALWQTRRADAANADVRLARIGIWQGVANVFIFGLENVLTIWLAVGFVIHGDGFSVGMIFAYMAYKSQFIQKTEGLVGQYVQYRMLGLHLERIADIAMSDEDKSFSAGAQIETKLRGGLELRDVKFRYSPSDPFVLKGVDLVVRPGEHVAITGPSGGGKTTLVKILLGLVEPGQGSFLVDGLPLESFGYLSYRRQVAGVMQDDCLFRGSLAENIALFDEQMDMDRIRKAAKDASIHDDILGFPMQYETWVGELGSTLSGGQKQRVLLARALYREPRILIMDEGTAHLDTRHEKLVNEAIAAMGITRIVIAHRRETIEAADRILAMDAGRLEPMTPG